jgi:hypothetical protein
MTTTTSVKPPTSFWIVASVALVWNLLGVIAYLGTVMMTPEALAALPAEQQALIASTPKWATAAFAIAVWGGTLGCVLLLLRKKWATTVLIISFLGIVMQMVHAFFIANSIEVYGPGGMIMPAMVLIIGAWLVWYSKGAEKKGLIS